MNFHITSMMFKLIPSSNFHRYKLMKLNARISLWRKNKSHIFTYSNKILKIISNLVSPLLSLIINKALTTRYFPNSLKTIRVVPIFKAGDQSNLKNYHSISILPIFSKIFERVVQKHYRTIWIILIISIHHSLDLYHIYQHPALFLILCNIFIIT